MTVLLLIMKINKFIISAQLLKSNTFFNITHSFPAIARYKYDLIASF